MKAVGDGYKLSTILEALGEASVCWTKPEGAGTFLSERAIAVGRELLAKLNAIYATELAENQALRDEVAALKAVAEAMRRTAAWHSPTVDDVE